MRRSQLQSALDRLAAAEQQFLASQFLAPMVGGGGVRVRIAGVACQLKVAPADFTGFGIFRPVSHLAAELVAPASLAMRRQYLSLFPVARLILCHRESSQWLAVAAHHGDTRFQIAGRVPVFLAEEAQQFDVVLTRYDGGNFWYEGPDPAKDPATAAWLRTQLRQGIEPCALSRPGLTPEERLAFALESPVPSQELPDRETAADEDPQRRLRRALEHAGAELIEYRERGDGYLVTYSIGGRQHISSVDKRDLTVQAAGICLSGQDQDFDLASLIGVLHEGATGG